MNKKIEFYLKIMNNDKYDFEKSQEFNDFLYWTEWRKNIWRFEENPVVYIYESTKGRIICKCDVIESDLYDEDGSIYELQEKYTKKLYPSSIYGDRTYIKLGNFVYPKDDSLLTFELLKKNGLKKNRAGHNISNKKDLILYIESAFKEILTPNEIRLNHCKNKILEMIDIAKDPEEKLYLKTKSRQFSEFIRNNYRTNLRKRNNRYNDIDNKEFDDLSQKSNSLFEAAHIVDVKHIKMLIDEYAEQLKKSKNTDNIKQDFDLMLSTFNGIFMPFKYHHYFDKDIIYLNSQLNFIVNNKFENIPKIFNEEFFGLKRDLLNSKEIIRLVELRNKYREN